MSFLARKIISAGAKEDPVDDDFKFTTLLIHADGSNGGTNNQSGVSFLDTSDEGHSVIDPNTAVFPGTFSPFSADEGKWSGKFDRTYDYFVFDDSDFSFGTGDFTIECFVYFDVVTTSGQGLFQLSSGHLNSQDGRGPAIGTYNGTGKWHIYYGAGENQTNTLGSSIAAPEVGKWIHVAYVRTSGVIKVFIDGTQIGSDISYTGNYTDSHFTLGGWYSSSYTLGGSLSNFRVVKGTAVYTGNFTVPTAPLTAITNTKLLTCCSNRFRDKSTSGHTLLHSTTSAVNPMNSTNHPQIQPFSPFAPSNAYSASTNGGSCFFNQTDNSHLTVSDATDFDFGTGDYTIEMWAYPTATSFNNSWSMVINTIGVNQYWAWTDGAGNANIAGLSTTPTSGYSVDFADIPEPFQWSHVVFQNTSGVANWYLNGTRIYNVTHNENTSASATGLQIGDSPHYTGQFQYGGYLTDIRVVKGSNAYTNGSTITVPTAPLTKITNTKLLLNFTQASIIDQTGKNNIRANQSMGLNTSVKKFGTASLLFDGTVDFLELPAQPSLDFGTSDFTIEFFFNSDNVTSLRALISSYKYYVAGNNGNWLLRITNNTTITWASYDGTGTENLKNFTVPTMSTGTWYHLALVRSGSNLNLYFNGTVSSSGALTEQKNLLDGGVNGILIGYANLAANNDYDGYMDEIRITKKARYTSNFTAPTEAFLDK